MKTFVVILLGFNLLFLDNDISMLGVKIGSSDKVLDKIALKVVASNRNDTLPMVKYRTDNGNDFYITTMNGRVVFMENDWLHEQRGKKPLITEFQFGETSLRDVRKTFGTNGYAYQGRSYMKIRHNLLEFNCFELDSPNNEVLVVITRVSLKSNINENTVSDSLKLESLIVSDKAYLDKIWGDKKLYDSNYKKIKI